MRRNGEDGTPTGGRDQHRKPVLSATVPQTAEVAPPNPPLTTSEVNRTPDATGSGAVADEPTAKQYAVPASATPHEE